MRNHEWLAEEGATPVEKAAIQTGVSALSASVHSAGVSFGIGLAAFKNVVSDSLLSSHKQLQTSVLESPLIQGFNEAQPRVRAQTS